MKLKKCIRKATCIMALFGIMIGTYSSVYANDEYQIETYGVKHYTGTVKKLEDIVTGKTLIGSDMTAQNFCDAKTSGKLVSWATDIYNNRISDKVGYTTNKEVRMKYTKHGSNLNVRLVVSTALDQFNSVGTTGRFYS